MGWVDFAQPLQDKTVCLTQHDMVTSAFALPLQADLRTMTT